MLGFIERLVPAVASALEFHFLRYARNWIAAAAALVFAFVLWTIFATAPAAFSDTIVIIPRGTPVPDIAAQLAEAHIVRFAAILKDILRLSGAGERIPAGAYRFSEPTNVIAVAYRLITGDFGIPPVRITFTEGMTVRDMATRIDDSLPNARANDFLAAGQPYEGYLFPDTYSFLPSATAADIVVQLRAEFATKTAPLAPDIAASGHSLGDIVTMASLVEKEANTPADKRMVAGILWNRVKRGMPLQVDAVFGYIFNRDTYSPSFADLAVDSPYNTYKYKGLPPGPIDNPGLDSIEAALHPTATTDLYYLTGRDGKMHYAATYAEHLANQRKYLP